MLSTVLTLTFTSLLLFLFPQLQTVMLKNASGSKLHAQTLSSKLISKEVKDHPDTKNRVKTLQTKWWTFSILYITNTSYSSKLSEKKVWMQSLKNNKIAALKLRLDKGKNKKNQMINKVREWQQLACCQIVNRNSEIIFLNGTNFIVHKKKNSQKLFVFGNLKIKKIADWA